MVATKPWLLASITATIAGAALVGAVVAKRHAPAVTAGLIGGLIAGTIGFFVEVADGPHYAPQTVAVWASAGLAVCGLTGLFVLHASEPGERLFVAALLVAVLAPFVGAAALLLLQEACPLYVRGRSYCFYDIDVLGGWSAGVATLIGLDLLGIAFLLVVSAWQAHRIDPPGPGAQDR